MVGPPDPFASTEKGPLSDLGGTFVGEYEVGALLATGGMGAVYAARIG